MPPARRVYKLVLKNIIMAEVDYKRLHVESPFPIDLTPSEIGFKSLYGTQHNVPKEVRKEAYDGALGKYGFVGYSNPFVV